MPKFNRSVAAEYAGKHALAPNPSYPAFPNDCTSFVSQCMLAGGWTMIGGSFGDRTKDSVWWWGKSALSRASYTWGGAHNFWKFLSITSRGSICPRNDLTIGDVVQISKDGHVFHTMIVSALLCSEDGDGPYLSYHTTNTLNKFLDIIEGLYPSSGGYTFYYWKIADVF